MKKQLQKIVFCLFILVGFSSCKPKIDSKAISAGEIDATAFVAIGGSMTAGFMDDALFSDGQNASIGNLLAGQLKLVGSGSFIQPLMSSNYIGCNADGKSSLRLGYKTDCLGVSSLSPIRNASNGDISDFSQNVFSSGFNNFGIPLLASTALGQMGYGTTNAYFARMTSDPATDKVLTEVLAMNPTFFSFFVGMDEVVTYARKGGSVGSMTPVNGAVGIGFDGSIEQALNDLTANGAKGIVSNIPDVTDLPYFTTIPYNGLNLTEEKAASLNQIYNPIGIYFQVGANPFMIEDPSTGIFGVRQMEKGELVLLSVPLDSVKCNSMGSLFPFRNEFVLTLTEIAEIQSKTQAYNNVLENLSIQRNLAFVDSYSFLKKLKSGHVYNGISLSLKFVSGGVVSLDGLTFNPKGNALLTNEFIKTINIKYASTIPLVDVTSYRSTIFP
jgi:hypothetical protein